MSLKLVIYCLQQLQISNKPTTFKL